MKTMTYLAFDLGAGSGRAVLGRIEGGTLSVREIARFSNEIVRMAGGLFWDLEAITGRILDCLSGCARSGVVPDSIAVDAWGVDYALVGRDGKFLGRPRSYRDPRTGPSFEALASGPKAPRIYELTGVQLLPINTLFQLHAERAADPGIFGRARALLFIPDAVNFVLTGAERNERTVASTSQLMNPSTGSWEPELLAAAGVPASLMMPIAEPMEILGRLSPETMARTGLPAVPVAAAGSHDTASAVAAAPACGGSWAYISSGTWSLVGVETARPVAGREAFEANFTNEAGVFGTWRFLRNVCGMWLVSECMRSWGGSQDYGALMREAASSEPFRTLVDPDWPGFQSPADMPAAISAFAAATGQPAPRGRGEFMRAVFEGLALKYRIVLEKAAEIAGVRIEAVHVVGGGSRMSLLNRFIADAVGIEVVAGPAEASAAGNILVQAAADGMFGSLAEIRECSRRSFATEAFEHGDRGPWDRACGRMLRLMERENGAHGAGYTEQADFS